MTLAVDAEIVGSFEPWDEESWGSVFAVDLSRWKPNLHPRDSHGKFRNKWSLSEKAMGMVDGVLRHFNPSSLKDDNDAAERLRRAKKPRTKKQDEALDYFLTRAGNEDVQSALRSGWDEDQSNGPSAEVHALDGMMAPLPEDMILSRVVGPDAFGLRPDQMEGVEEWTGKLSTDKGYSPTNMGNPHQIAGPHIEMRILAPKGTKAIIAGDGSRTVVLDREQPLRFTQVQKDGKGGYYILAIVMPKQGNKEIPHGLGRDLRPQDKSPAIDATPDELARRGLSPEDVGPPGPQAEPDRFGDVEGVSKAPRVVQPKPAYVPPEATPAPVGEKPPSEGGPAKAIKKAGGKVPVGAGKVTTKEDVPAETPDTETPSRQALPEAEARALDIEAQNVKRQQMLDQRQERLEKAQAIQAKREAAMLDRQEKDNERLRAENDALRAQQEAGGGTPELTQEQKDQQLVDTAVREQKERDDAVVRRVEQLRDEPGWPRNEEEERLQRLYDGIQGERAGGPVADRSVPPAKPVEGLPAKKASTPRVRKAATKAATPSAAEAGPEGAPAKAAPAKAVRQARAAAAEKPATLASLRKEATDLKVPGRSRMTKPQLEEALSTRRRRDGESDEDHANRLNELNAPRKVTRAKATKAAAPTKETPAKAPEKIAPGTHVAPDMKEQARKQREREVLDAAFVDSDEAQAAITEAKDGLRNGEPGDSVRARLRRVARGLRRDGNDNDADKLDDAADGLRRAEVTPRVAKKAAAPSGPSTEETAAAKERLRKDTEILDTSTSSSNPGAGAVKDAKRSLARGDDRDEVVQGLRTRAEELRSGEPLQSDDMPDRLHYERADLDEIAGIEANDLDRIADELEAAGPSAPAAKKAAPSVKKAAKKAPSVEEQRAEARRSAAEERNREIGLARQREQAPAKKAAPSTQELREGLDQNLVDGAKAEAVAQIEEDHAAESPAKRAARIVERLKQIDEKGPTTQAPVAKKAAPAKKAVSARLTPAERATQRRIDTKATRLHQDWQKTQPLLEDGTRKPKFKPTKDQTWIDAHGGADQVDIANTDYKDLPDDWQLENREAARVVDSILERRGGKIDLTDEKTRLEVGEEIHAAWLSRHGDEKWEGDDGPTVREGELGKPFKDLDPKEQAKDIDQVYVAMGRKPPVAKKAAPVAKTAAPEAPAAKAAAPAAPRTSGTAEDRVTTARLYSTPRSGRGESILVEQGKDGTWGPSSQQTATPIQITRMERVMESRGKGYYRITGTDPDGNEITLRNSAPGLTYTSAPVKKAAPERPTITRAGKKTVPAKRAEAAKKAAGGSEDIEQRLAREHREREAKKAAADRIAKKANPVPEAPAKKAAPTKKAAAKKAPSVEEQRAEARKAAASERNLEIGQSRQREQATKNAAPAVPAAVKAAPSPAASDNDLDGKSAGQLRDIAAKERIALPRTGTAEKLAREIRDERAKRNAPSAPAAVKKVAPGKEARLSATEEAELKEIAKYAFHNTKLSRHPTNKAAQKRFDRYVENGYLEPIGDGQGSYRMTDKGRLRAGQELDTTRSAPSAPGTPSQAETARRRLLAQDKADKARLSKDMNADQKAELRGLDKGDQDAYWNERLTHGRDHDDAVDRVTREAQPQSAQAMLQEAPAAKVAKKAAAKVAKAAPRKRLSAEQARILRESEAAPDGVTTVDPDSPEVKDLVARKRIRLNPRNRTQAEVIEPDKSAPAKSTPEPKKSTVPDGPVSEWTDAQILRRADEIGNRANTTDDRRVLNRRNQILADRAPAEAPEAPRAIQRTGGNAPFEGVMHREDEAAKAKAAKKAAAKAARAAKRTEPTKAAAKKATKKTRGELKAEQVDQAAPDVPGQEGELLRRSKDRIRNGESAADVKRDLTMRAERLRTQSEGIDDEIDLGGRDKKHLLDLADRYDAAADAVTARRKAVRKAKPEPTGRDADIERAPKSELVQVARRHGIPSPHRFKVGELRQMIKDQRDKGVTAAPGSDLDVDAQLKDLGLPTSAAALKKIAAGRIPGHSKMTASDFKAKFLQAMKDGGYERPGGDRDLPQPMSAEAMSPPRAVRKTARVAIAKATAAGDDGTIPEDLDDLNIKELRELGKKNNILGHLVLSELALKAALNHKRKDPNSIPISGELISENLRKDLTPERLRESARTQGIELKGDTVDDLITDYIQQSVQSKAGEKAQRAERQAARKAAAQARLSERNHKFGPDGPSHIDARRLAADNDIDTKDIEQYVDGAQADLNNGKTPGMVAKDLDNSVRTLEARNVYVNGDWGRDRGGNPEGLPDSHWEQKAKDRSKLAELIGRLKKFADKIRGAKRPVAKKTAAAKKAAPDAETQKLGGSQIADRLKPGDRITFKGLDGPVDTVVKSNDGYAVRTESGHILTRDSHGGRLEVTLHVPAAKKKVPRRGPGGSSSPVQTEGQVTDSLTPRMKQQVDSLDAPVRADYMKRRVNGDNHVTAMRAAKAAAPKTAKKAAPEAPATPEKTTVSRAIDRRGPIKDPSARAKAWGTEKGYKGGIGGWISGPDGKTTRYQGWQSLYEGRKAEIDKWEADRLRKRDEQLHARDMAALAKKTAAAAKKAAPEKAAVAKAAPGKPTVTRATSRRAPNLRTLGKGMDFNESDNHTLDFVQGRLARGATKEEAAASLEGSARSLREQGDLTPGRRDELHARADRYEKLAAKLRGAPAAKATPARKATAKKAVAKKAPAKVAEKKAAAAPAKSTPEPKESSLQRMRRERAERRKRDAAVPETPEQAKSREEVQRLARISDEKQAKEAALEDAFTDGLLTEAGIDRADLSDMDRIKAALIGGRVYHKKVSRPAAARQLEEGLAPDSPLHRLVAVLKKLVSRKKTGDKAPERPEPPKVEPKKVVADAVPDVPEAPDTEIVRRTDLTPRRKGEHLIKLPDGTVAKRTSATRDYTHAVVVTKNNHKEADRLERYAQLREEAAKAYEEAARTGDWSKFRRHSDGGNARHTSYRVDYIHPGGEREGGRISFKSLDPKDVEADNNYWQETYDEFDRRDTAAGRPLTKRNDWNRRGMTVEDQRDYSIKSSMETNDRVVAGLRKESKSLRTKPEEEHYVARWSSSQKNAMQAQGSVVPDAGEGIYRTRVVPVGTDMSGGKASTGTITRVERGGRPDVKPPTKARATKAAPEAPAKKAAPAEVAPHEEGDTVTYNGRRGTVTAVVRSRRNNENGVTTVRFDGEDHETEFPTRDIRAAEGNGPDVQGTAPRGAKKAAPVAQDLPSAQRADIKEILDRMPKDRADNIRRVLSGETREAGTRRNSQAAAIRREGDTHLRMAESAYRANPSIQSVRDRLAHAKALNEHFARIADLVDPRKSVKPSRKKLPDIPRVLESDVFQATGGMPGEPDAAKFLRSIENGGDNGEAISLRQRAGQLRERARLMRREGADRIKKNPNPKSAEHKLGQEELRDAPKLEAAADVFDDHANGLDDGTVAKWRVAALGKETDYDTARYHIDGMSDQQLRNVYREQYGTRAGLGSTTSESSLTRENLENRLVNAAVADARMKEGPAPLVADDRDKFWKLTKAERARVRRKVSDPKDKEQWKAALANEQDRRTERQIQEAQARQVASGPGPAKAAPERPVKVTRAAAKKVGARKAAPTSARRADDPAPGIGPTLERQSGDPRQRSTPDIAQGQTLTPAGQRALDALGPDGHPGIADISDPEDKIRAGVKLLQIEPYSQDSHVSFENLRKVIGNQLTHEGFDDAIKRLFNQEGVNVTQQHYARGNAATRIPASVKIGGTDQDHITIQPVGWRKYNNIIGGINERRVTGDIDEAEAIDRLQAVRDKIPDNDEGVTGRKLIDAEIARLRSPDLGGGVRSPKKTAPAAKKAAPAAPEAPQSLRQELDKALDLNIDDDERNSGAQAIRKALEGPDTPESLRERAKQLDDASTADLRLAGMVEANRSDQPGRVAALKLSSDRKHVASQVLSRRADRIEKDRKDLSDGDRGALEQLIAGGGGGSKGRGLTKDTFRPGRGEDVDSLERRGLVRHEGDGNDRRYKVTEAGEKLFHEDELTRASSAPAPAKKAARPVSEQGQRVRAMRERARADLKDQGFDNPSQEMVEQQMEALRRNDEQSQDRVRSGAPTAPRPPSKAAQARIVRESNDKYIDERTKSMDQMEGRLNDPKRIFTSDEKQSGIAELTRRAEVDRLHADDLSDHPREKRRLLALADRTDKLRAKFEARPDINQKLINDKAERRSAYVARTDEAYKSLSDRFGSHKPTAEAIQNMRDHDWVLTDQTGPGMYRFEPRDGSGPGMTVSLPAREGQHVSFLGPRGRTTYKALNEFIAEHGTRKTAPTPIKKAAAKKAVPAKKAAPELSDAAKAAQREHAQELGRALHEGEAPTPQKATRPVKVTRAGSEKTAGSLPDRLRGARDREHAQEIIEEDDNNLDVLREVAQDLDIDPVQPKVALRKAILDKVLSDRPNKRVAKKALPEVPNPDPDTAAVDAARQRLEGRQKTSRIETARGRMGLAENLHQIIDARRNDRDKGTFLDAVRERLSGATPGDTDNDRDRVAQGWESLRKELGPEKNWDTPDKLDTRLRTVLAKHGVSVDHKIGDEVSFDPATMDTNASGLKAGDRVRIMQPGLTYRDKDGTSHPLVSPTVTRVRGEEAGGQPSITDRVIKELGLQTVLRPEKRSPAKVAPTVQGPTSAAGVRAAVQHRRTIAPDTRPAGIHDGVVSGVAPTYRGEVAGILTRDTGPQGLPVQDLTVSTGYTVKKGRIWRQNGTTYIAEFDESSPEETKTAIRALGEARAHQESLPPEAKRFQRAYIITRGTNPNDSYWADQFGAPDFQSAATAMDGETTIWGGAVDGKVLTNLRRSTFDHEFGHNFESAAAAANLGDDSPRWRSAVETDTPGANVLEFSPAPSGSQIRMASDAGTGRMNHTIAVPQGVTSYGTASFGEDYAESMRLYLAGTIGQGIPAGELVRRPIYFRDLFPARAAVFDQILPDFANDQRRDIETGRRLRRLEAHQARPRVSQARGSRTPVGVG